MDRMNSDTAARMAEAYPECEVPARNADILLPGVVHDPSPRERVARIVRTIESDIIPRLLRAHEPRPDAPVAPSVAVPTADEVVRFVGLVLADNDAGWAEMIALLRDRGASVESLYMDLLSPAAQELGRLWDEDLCLFSDVTVAVGRLQRIMRSLSPAFGTEVAHPEDGRRVLLLPAPGEQHTFGLSMVAEFFLRAGWDVTCDFDSRVVDPVGLVRSAWFDVVGISVGGDARIDWLRSGIAAVRQASRNRAVGVMVGGPIFVANPERAITVGADGTAIDGRRAPEVAERLLGERTRRL